MHVDKDKLEALRKQVVENKFETGYIDVVNGLRRMYSSMLGNSKTLLDVIIHNDKRGAKVDIRTKLVIKDLVEVLAGGKELSFDKYTVIEHIGAMEHKLELELPRDYKNYTASKFEFNYLINKIGIIQVMNIMQVIRLD